jgi:quercetin dioxygenase-like cupin family protein
MEFVMQQPAPERPYRTVKQVETIMADPLIRARVFTLAPREVIPWHRHSEVTDHYFVLRGHLTVETRGQEPRNELRIGERFKITPGTEHQLANDGPVDCEFLLLQGTGAYDWISCPDSN